jgi:hypothetical protein
MPSVGPRKAPAINVANTEQVEASTIGSSVYSASTVGSSISSTSVPSTVCSSVSSASTVGSSISSTSVPTTATRQCARTTRPYVKRLKTRHDDSIPELIREILSAQERFHTRMTPYDKAIQIFQERFMFGFTSIQQSRIITLFAESDSLVRQYMSFNEEQRDVLCRR